MKIVTVQEWFCVSEWIASLKFSNILYLSSNNKNQLFQEDAANLLLFESSHEENEKKITLNDYIARAKENNTIFYLSAPR